MTRYTIDLSEDFDRILSRIASEKEITKSEVIRNAVASYWYLIQEIEREDLKVSISNREDKVVKDVILP
jgi:hypothetical protein